MATIRTGKHNKKLRLGIYLKLWNKDKLVLSTVYRINSRVRASVASTSHNRGYIKVTYSPGYWNDGEYSNDEDLLGALSAFTEKTLTDEFL